MLPGVQVNMKVPSERQAASLLALESGLMDLEKNEYMVR